MFRVVYISGSEMRYILIICFLFIPLFSYGEVKKITKTERVVVPQNQSVEQVLKYTSEKLARQAAEEAGVAISTDTVLVDGKISKDEIKMQTSAIAQKETKLLKQETIKGVTYITVQVTATVDSAELDAFLRQLMQNEALKKELEQERKAKLDLEKKLKNASKEEYDKTLSKEAENIAKVQATRQKQLEIEMANAKQQLMEAERRQKQAELEAVQELERLEKEYKAQDAALKKKIAEEKNAEAKAEMEYQALLAELTQNALINDKTLDAAASDTIEMIVIDAASVRVNFAALIKEYKTVTDANNKKLKQLHDNQLKLVKNQTFQEKKPVKGEWEQTNEYKSRLAEYEKHKKEFESNKNEKIKNIESAYKEKIENNKTEATKSLVKTLEPLYKRLQKYSNGQYISSKTVKAVISFGERNIDQLKLPIYIKYDGKKYSFDYIFDSVEEFRTMYETRGSFKAIPLFGAEAKSSSHAKSYLTGFNVVHLGNNKTQFFKVDAGYNIFPEIEEYEKMLEVLNPKPKEEPVKKSEIKYHTSDMHKSSYDYKDEFWFLGFNFGGGFNLDAFIADLTLQTHWRFNRWTGLYTNLGFLLGTNKIQSGRSMMYDDYYYYSSSNISSSSGMDYSIFAGVGLELYLSNDFILFGEVNGGYFFDTYGKNSAGLLAKGGFSIQIDPTYSKAYRLNIFVERILTTTVSGETPFFGAGFQF